MKQVWEYQVKKYSSVSVPESLVQFLNVEGKSGWEVVTITERDNFYFVYFKRPKNV